MIFVGLSFSSCGGENSTTENGQTQIDTVVKDLDQIREEGVLKAITTYSAISYFIYKGEPMGYEYELLQKLAEDMGLELEIVVARDLDHMTDMLMQGEGDLIAHILTITQERKEYLAFADRHLRTSQVLVQRKPDNWRNMKLHEIEEELIRDPNDLRGKEVHVRRESAYFDRLQSLSNEIGGEIKIVESPGYLATEEIISEVAEGQFDYTIADDIIAKLNETYHHNLDVETVVGLPQRLGWAMRKTSPELKKYVSNWFDELDGTLAYNVIYKKYFEDKKDFVTRVKSEYFSKNEGRISPYDDLIKERAAKIGWDWRLLASLIFQESRFDPQARSWVGARGLMQLMPATARQFGASDPHDVKENLKAGTNFLAYLDEHWSETIPDSAERVKFILASYNAGLGHVQDAQRLAEKYGKDPQAWDGHVAEMLLEKKDPKYYRDEVSKHGYCRGDEPYNYVEQIIERAIEYQKLLPAETRV